MNKDELFNFFARTFNGKPAIYHILEVMLHPMINNTAQISSGQAGGVAKALLDLCNDTNDQGIGDLDFIPIASFINSCR